MTMLAGADALCPHRRSEITSEHTSRCPPAHEAAEVDLALELVPRLVGTREERRIGATDAARPGRRAWRSPASTQRSGTHAMWVITLARSRGGAPGRRRSRARSRPARARVSRR